MPESRIEVWRQQARNLARPPERGAEHIGSILPRVMQTFADRVQLGVVDRAKFAANPEASLDGLLRESKDHSGSFDAKTILDVLFYWIRSDTQCRFRIRRWLEGLPEKCRRNKRQAPFLSGLGELLGSFEGEQGGLFQGGSAAL